MSLRDWARNGWLVAHRTSREEIGNLLAIVERDLRACRTEGLDTDWRFNIAYNAALQAATAALAASGYRAARDGHHFRVIQSLELTIGADRSTVRRFDTFRKKRNQGGYELAGLVSETELADMTRLAEGLAREVSAWLQREHSELLDRP